MQSNADGDNLKASYRERGRLVRTLVSLNLIRLFALCARYADSRAAFPDVYEVIKSERTENY